MEVDERLDDFVSERAFTQFKQLHEVAVQSTEDMAKLSETARAAFADLGGTQTLAQLINLTAKATQANKDMANVVVTLNAEYENFGKAVGVVSGSMDKNLQQLVEGKTRMKDVQEQLANLNKEMADGSISQEKFYQKSIQLTEELSRLKISTGEYTASINAEIKAADLASSATAQLTAETTANRLALAARNAEVKKSIQLQNAVPNSIAEARIQSQLWRTELNNLNLTTTEGIARQKELIALIAERDNFVKSNVDAYTAQKINIGNYPDATNQLTALNAEMQALSATGQEGSAEFSALAAKVTELKSAMGGVSGELAILTKQMQEMVLAGKQDSQEFQEMTEKATQLKYAVKEVQAIINTGITSPTQMANSTITTQLALVKTEMQQLALAGKQDSVEFRELTAEAQRLTMALNEVSTSIKGATSIGDRFTNIIEKMGLRFIANLVIFQAGMELFTALQTRWEDAVKRIQAVTQPLIAINTKAADTFSESAAKMELYISRLTDVASTIDDKKEAIKDLNRDFADQGMGLKDINEFNEVYIARARAFVEATMLRAQALGAMGVVQDKIKENIVNQASKGNNLLDGLDKGLAFLGKMSLGGQQYILAKKGNDRLKEVTDENNKIIQDAISKYKQFESAALALDKINGFDTDPNDKKGKTPRDGAKNDTEALYAAQKKYFDAISELYKKQYEEDILTQKKIIDSNRATIDERIQAAYQMHEDLYQMSKLDNDRQINDQKIELNKLNAQLSENNRQQVKLKAEFAKGNLNITKDSYTIELNNLKTKNAAFVLDQTATNIKIGTLEENANKLRADNLEKTTQEIVGIQKDEVKKRVDALKDLSNNVDIQEQQALQHLDEQLKDGTVKYKNYADDRKEIEDKFQKEKLSEIRDYLQQEIDYLNKKGVNTTALQELLNKNLADLYKADLKTFTDNEKLKEAAKKELNDKIQEAVSQLITTGKSLVDNYYETQLNYQQRILDGIERQKTASQDYINNSMMNDRQKATATAALNAEMAAKEKAAHDAMVKIKREQAIAERVAAVLSITEQLSIAEVSALKYLGDPITAPLYPAIAAVIAGIGAAEIVTVLAAPMPQYAEGTANHPGGPALIGEQFKPELVIEPGKAPYMIDKPTIVADLAAKSRVIPQDELMSMAGSFGYMTPGMLNQLNVSQNIDFSKLEDATNKGFSELKQAVLNKKETHFHWNNGELRKSVKNGSSTTDYINKNFS
jgi:hypothetical protein